MCVVGGDCDSLTGGRTDVSYVLFNLYMFLLFFLTCLVYIQNIKKFLNQEVFSRQV